MCIKSKIIQELSINYRKNVTCFSKLAQARCKNLFYHVIKNT